MADVHSPQTRSYNMSRIKGKNTRPEMLVRRFLFANGFRYRLHDDKLPGKPDIVLPRYKTVIFVHGCFWHGHEGCRYFVVPKTRTEWWMQKIEGNKLNDSRKVLSLEEMGWNCITIWECQLKQQKLNFTLKTLLSELISH